MRVLLVGAGGVGTAFARIAARRGVFEHIVVADHAIDRAQRAAQAASDRFERRRTRRPRREGGGRGRCAPSAATSWSTPWTPAS